MAAGLKDNAGTYLVPAFTGLGAPYWGADVRGAIFGLTRGTGAAHIVRPGLEAVCYQTYDLITAMAADVSDGASANATQVLWVDGGMVANNWLMKFLCDTLKLSIDRPRITETSALGAAFLASLHVGIFKNFDDMRNTWQREQSFVPEMDETEREKNVKGWQAAVRNLLSETTTDA